MSRPERIIRILLADDSLPYREMLTMLLGLDPDLEIVAQAGDGAEAIELTKKHRPDVVLLDVAMPLVDGLQALPEIKAAEPSTKVIMLSAFSAREMLQRATSGGADAYLEKGAPLDEIRRTITGFFPR